MGSRFWLAATMLASLAACEPRAAVDDPAVTATAAAPDMHTSENSLDWAGTYEGVLPCADCAGVFTTLRLDTGGTYALVTRRLVAGEANLRQEGDFTWSADGGSISLASGTGLATFLVGEGRLFAFDADGTLPAADAGASLALVEAAETTPAQVLEGHTWSLVEATESDNARIDALFPEAARGFALAFADGRLNVTGGCNGLRAGYQLTPGGQLSVAGAATTRMACEPSLMAADSVLAALFAVPLELVLVRGPSPELALIAATGEVLLFRGEQTHEARFGPARTVFFEVGPHRLPCDDAASADGLCLQIREIGFDAQGLRVGKPGEFVPFAGSIEGYEHSEGTRNVLRVKHFESENVPRNGVMVLDLVVESESAPQ